MARILITGANRGIGLELAKQLVARGDEVIALCRRPSEELVALGAQVFDGVDITDPTALQTVSDALADTAIDVLINNAGVFSDERLDSLDFAQIRMDFEVNALGALRATSIFRSHLREGSKVILITSRMGSIEDNGSGGYYGYRMSKAALNMAGVNLAHDLRPNGISVAVLHPGLVATAMTGHSGIPTEKSARGLIARIDGLRLDDSGGFWHAEGQRLPW